MDYSIFANPTVHDWQEVINARAYAKAADSYTGGDTPGAMNALIGIGQVGQANAMKGWQDDATSNALAKSVGGAYASGDTQGAINTAMKGGNFDLAGKVQGFHQNITNQALADANRDLEKTTTLLEHLKGNPTPENWDLVKRAAVSTGRYKPADIAKMDQQIAQQGIQPTIDFYHTQLLGAQGKIAETQKTLGNLGRLGQQYLSKPDGWAAAAQAFSAAHGNPAWMKPYLAPDGMRIAIASAGLSDGSADVKYGLSPQYYTDEKGNLRLGQLSSAGGDLRPVNVPGKVAPVLAIKDTGTEQTAIDTRTGQAVTSVANNVEEAARVKERGEARGKFEGEKPAKFAKASQAIADLERAHGLVQQDIDRAIAAIESGIIPKTGMFALARVLPGTAANDLAEILKGVKANISFDKLQAMREASPTGGALGQVSDYENKLLQATSGSLEQEQSGEQLLTHLKRLKGQFKDLGAQRRAAFERDFAGMGKQGVSALEPGAAEAGAEVRVEHDGKIFVKRGGKWIRE